MAEVAAETRVHSVIANPGPLGLLGFGLTTVALSSVNAGLLPPECVAAIVPLAFAFGGTAQFVAGIMEFRAANTFGATAFTSYAMFWWWFALLKWSVGAGWVKAPPAMAVGAILLLWGVLTTGLWLVTFRLNKALWVLFLLLAVTFFLLSAADFGYMTSTAGGYLGLVTGVVAFLIAIAELVNAAAKRTVVGLGAPFVK
jgi:succinate-acetate transporter protein